MIGQKEQDDILSSLYSYLCAINIKAIFPFLIEQKLITSDEREHLLNPHHSDGDKVNKLMVWLPKKGPDALTRFIQCLEDSSDGTGHEVLAKKIRKAMYEKAITVLREYIGKLIIIFNPAMDGHFL